MNKLKKGMGTLIRDEVIEMASEQLATLISGISEELELEEPEELFDAILISLITEMEKELTTIEVAYGVTRILDQFLAHISLVENRRRKMYPRMPDGCQPELN